MVEIHRVLHRNQVTSDHTNDNFNERCNQKNRTNWAATTRANLFSSADCCGSVVPSEKASIVSSNNTSAGLLAKLPFSKPSMWIGCTAILKTSITCVWKCAISSKLSISVPSTHRAYLYSIITYHIVHKPSVIYHYALSHIINITIIRKLRN